MQTVGARAVPWGSISSQARGIRAGKGRKKHPISCSFSGTTTPTPTGGDHALDTWMVLTLSAAATQSLENTRLGSVLSGPLIAIVVGLAAAGLGLVPATATSPVYGTISDVLLPLGVALYVLEVNVANVFSRESSSMLLAFLCGAFATTVGTIASYAVFSRYLSVDGMNIAAALCASYIGGSVNFASVIAALGTSLPSSVPAAMAADNLMMGMYIAVLMWLSTKAKSDAQTSAAATDGPMTASTMETMETATTATTLSAGIAAAFVCSRVAGVLAARVFGFPSISLALVSVVACVVAPLASRVVGRPSAALFSGSMSAASICMTLFFVSIGAIAGVGSLGSASALPLFGFIGMQLFVQLALSLLLGKLLRVPLDIVLIACNANVGGAATAVAMCIAKKWTHLVNAALLVASLGYIVGAYREPTCAGVPRLALSPSHWRYTLRSFSRQPDRLCRARRAPKDVAITR